MGWSRSDKYLASPPEGVIIVKEIYYRVETSRRWILFKISSRIESQKKQHWSAIRFLFLEGNLFREIKKRLDAVQGDSSPSRNSRSFRLHSTKTKTDGYSFFGFTRYDLHRLPGAGQNGRRALLCPFTDLHCKLPGNIFRVTKVD